MNLLIPCAGRGKRFFDVGYEKPKPFIDVAGEPMLKRAIDTMCLQYSDRVILLFLKDHIENYKEDIEYIKESIWTKNIEILSVDKITEGAACTALLAKDFINNDDELVITDCDHIITDEDHLPLGIEYFKKHCCDGGFWCHLNDDAKWSYVSISNGIVKEIVEKRVISNLANVGDYYFNMGRMFVESAERMIENNDRTRGEFYIAPTMQYMIADSMKLMPYMVNNFYGLGTPEDLKYFLGE